MSRLNHTQETALVVSEDTPRLPQCHNAINTPQGLASKASARTQKAYRQDIGSFLAFSGDKPLNWVELADLQRYQHQALVGQQTASQKRRLSAIKSLLTFGCKRFPQFFPVNIGAAFQRKQSKDTLAKRILPEETILDLRWRAATGHRDPYRERNAVLLRLLYKAALRREERCQLSWRDVQPRGGRTGANHRLRQGR